MEGFEISGLLYGGKKAGHKAGYCNCEEWTAEVLLGNVGMQLRVSA